MALTKVLDAGLNTPASDLQDNEKIVLGTGNDLEIHHSSNISTIKDGYGDLRIMSDTIRIQRNAGGENFLYATEGGKTSLYYDGTERIETTSVGVKVTGNYQAIDGYHIYMGTGNDLDIYHDGSLGMIDSVNNDPLKISAGTGNLFLQGANVRIGVEGQAEYCAKFIADGAVELYHDNALKLETISTGIRVLGSEGTAGEVFIYADEGDDDADKWVLEANTTGDFLIKNRAGGSWETNVKTTGGGAVELYHNNTKKLEVVSGGAEITGDFWIKDGTPGLYFVDTNDSDVTAKITNTSGNLKLESDTGNTTGTSSIRFSVDGTEEVRILAGGGITFNGDTAEANALDDYEYGSWTPTDSEGTIDVLSARYQKIGHIVWIWGAVDDFSHRTGTADIKIEGVPFTVSENGYGSAIFYRIAHTDVGCQTLVNTSEEVKFLVSSQGGSEAWFYLDYEDINASNSQIKFAVWYRTTQ